MTAINDYKQMQQIQHQIIQDFNVFTDWMDRYAYLVDLGKKLMRDGDHLKQDEHKIQGCQSNVWIAVIDRNEDKLYFNGTSDSAIVAGLMSLLLRVYSGHSAEAISQTKPDFIYQTGLLHNLTSQRSTGLAHMIERIHQIANQQRNAAVSL